MPRVLESLKIWAQLGSGGGVVYSAHPSPLYSRLLDRFLKTTWTVFSLYFMDFIIASFRPNTLNYLNATDSSVNLG
jgi:hypothetical protein